MVDKKSFLVFYDIKETLDELNDEQVGQLFRAMVDFEVNGDLPEFTGVLKMAWIPIRQTLTRAGAKYEETLEARREAGRLGGIASGETRRNKNEAKRSKPEAKRSKTENEETAENVENSIGEDTSASKQNEANVKQTRSKHEANEANEADSVSVSVSDSVSDSDSVSVRHSVSERTSDGTDDDQTDDTRLFPFGKLKNVMLTKDEHAEIVSTYQTPSKLIDKVSLWLPNAKKKQKNHYALVLKFAQNDSWPKKPPPEPAPEPKIKGEPCPEEIRAKMSAVLGKMALEVT